jgi:hypothetical protein
MARSVASLPLLLLLCLPAAAQAQDSTFEGLLDRLPDGLRTEVSGIVNDPTVTCEVTETARCTPRTYRFLLNHLPLSARALSSLGSDEVGSYTIEAREDGTYLIDDHAGATAVAEVIIEEEGLMVIVARGRVELPVIPAIDGTGVIVLRYASDEADPDLMRSTCLVSFRVANDTLHRMTAPFRRTLRRVLGRKLGLLIRSAVTLARSCEERPWDVYRGLRQVEGVQPDELREFREQFLAY